MLLTPHDLDQFFKLHRVLMVFVNQRLKVIPQMAPSIVRANCSRFHFMATSVSARACDIINSIISTQKTIA